MNAKRIIIKNTSRYPDNEVRWLVNFAARYVRSEMERMGDLERYDRHGFYLQLRNKQRCAYSGRYFNEVVNEKGSYPFGVQETFRRVLVKVGTPERFPVVSTYARYKDMPEAKLNDWQEAVVGLVAHEFSHFKFSGRKDGEYNAELIEQDCVAKFRQERPTFETAMQAGVVKFQERELAMAAKQSPEAVLNQKLAKAQKQMATWARKQKLATTKAKKYAREVKRLAKRVQEFATKGINKL